MCPWAVHILPRHQRKGNSMQHRAVRLTDKVKAGLIDLIAAEQLGAGQKLPTAEQLCLRFAVSRTVIREAIASLQAEGRLISRRGSGVYVSEPSPSLVTGLTMGSPQDLADVLELMELRMSVEIEAAGLAAERRSETDLLRIEQAMSSFARHMQGQTLASDADRALHRAIAQATNNPKFAEFVDHLGERLIPRRALGAAFADITAQAAFLGAIHQEHRVIADAIANRQPLVARNSMRLHLENGRRRYRDWNLQHQASGVPA